MGEARLGRVGQSIAVLFSHGQAGVSCNCTSKYWSVSSSHIIAMSGPGFHRLNDIVILFIDYK